MGDGSGGTSIPHTNPKRGRGTTLPSLDLMTSHFSTTCTETKPVTTTTSISTSQVSSSDSNNIYPMKDNVSQEFGTTLTKPDGTEKQVISTIATTSSSTIATTSKASAGGAALGVGPPMVDTKVGHKVGYHHHQHHHHHHHHQPPLLKTVSIMDTLSELAGGGDVNKIAQVSYFCLWLVDI